jgi:cysteine desulfurase/selenocysteine lyase
MTTINPLILHDDFPLLSSRMAGKPIVYLDNAATTQKPKAVIEALTDFYSSKNANIHRGVYELAEIATKAYEDARVQTARFINAPNANNVIFTRNTTESINLVAHSWARKHLRAGDEILLTEMEHHANIIPWYLLSKERGIKLKMAPLAADHTLDLDAFKKMLTPQVKLVAVTAMSNVLGTINPVKQLASWAHANKSLILVDGAQSVPHMTTDVQDLDCDFFAFSAHKMLGPTGVGVLWVRENILDTMDPFLGGGEMINTVSLTETTWAEAPLKFEAGTSNFADVAAFSVSLSYLNKLGMNAIRAHEKELTAYTLAQLKKRPDIILYGPQDAEKQGGAISFNHKIVHAHDVGTILGEEGVAIRVGHHCAQPLMKALKTPATARASFYIYNTKEDADAFLKALDRVDVVFGLGAKK